MLNNVGLTFIEKKNLKKKFIMNFFGKYSIYSLNDLFSKKFPLFIEWPFFPKSSPYLLNDTFSKKFPLFIEWPFF